MGEFGAVFQHGKAITISNTLPSSLPPCEACAPPSSTLCDPTVLQPPAGFSATHDCTTGDKRVLTRLDSETGKRAKGAQPAWWKAHPTVQALPTRVRHVGWGVGRGVDVGWPPKRLSVCAPLVPSGQRLPNLKRRTVTWKGQKADPGRWPIANTDYAIWGWRVHTRCRCLCRWGKGQDPRAEPAHLRAEDRIAAGLSRV